MHLRFFQEACNISVSPFFQSLRDGVLGFFRIDLGSGSLQDEREENGGCVQSDLFPVTFQRPLLEEICHDGGNLFSDRA